MTTRKPESGKQARLTPPLAEKPATKLTQQPKSSQSQPSRADEAHIATAGYWREQQGAIDRIAKLKALRLAQADKAETPKPKPAKKKTPSVSARPKTSRSRRWGT
jgi:hypothetical protein